MLPSGKTVLADERYYIIHVEKLDTDHFGWSEKEQKVICDQYWWSIEDLRLINQTVLPRDLLVSTIANP